MRSPNASYWRDASTKPSPLPAASAAAWAAAAGARGPWTWSVSSASRAAVVWSPNCVAVCRSMTSQAGRPSSDSFAAASRTIEIACDVAPSAAHVHASAMNRSMSHTPASASCAAPLNGRELASRVDCSAGHTGHGRQPRAREGLRHPPAAAAFQMCDRFLQRTLRRNEIAAAHRRQAGEKAMPRLLKRNVDRVAPNARDQCVQGCQRTARAGTRYLAPPPAAGADARLRRTSRQVGSRRSPLIRSRRCVQGRPAR